MVLGGRLGASRCVYSESASHRLLCHSLLGGEPFNTDTARHQKLQKDPSAPAAFQLAALSSAAFLLLQGDGGSRRKDASSSAAEVGRGRGRGYGRRESPIKASDLSGGRVLFVHMHKMRSERGRLSEWRSRPNLRPGPGQTSSGRRHLRLARKGPRAKSRGRGRKRVERLESPLSPRS